jgi:hypothetical protein
VVADQIMNFRFFREAKRAKISKKNKKRIFLLILHLFALSASLYKAPISRERAPQNPMQSANFKSP